jgi:hypothetical protein
MQAVANEARERGVVGLWTNVRHLVDYPYGLSVLVEWPALRGRPMPPATGAIGVIEFASEDRYDARLILRVLDPETGPPKRYFRVWPEVQNGAGTH